MHRNPLIPIDFCLLLEDFLESPESGAEVGANSRDDVVAREDFGAGKTAVEGIGGGVRVGLPDL